MKKTRLFIMLVFVGIISCGSVFAQDPTPDDPDAVPIDGGASFLVGAAVAYAIRRKKNKNQDSK